MMALRTPRMADEDDPDEPYTPPQELAANPTGEINVVFSEAVFGATGILAREHANVPPRLRDPPYASS